MPNMQFLLAPVSFHSEQQVTMPFKRYVEIGRVAFVNYGPENGQLVVISDVLDQNRVRAFMLNTSSSHAT